MGSDEHPIFGEMHAPFQERFVRNLKRQIRPEYDAEKTQLLENLDISDYHYPRIDPEESRELLDSYFGGAGTPFSPHTLRALVRTDPNWTKTSELYSFVERDAKDELMNPAQLFDKMDSLNITEQEKLLSMQYSLALNALDLPRSPVNELVLQLINREDNKVSFWWLDSDFLPSLHPLRLLIKYARNILSPVPVALRIASEILVGLAKIFKEEVLQPILDPVVISIWEFIGLQNWDWMGYIGLAFVGFGLVRLWRYSSVFIGSHDFSKFSTDAAFYEFGVKKEFDSENEIFEDIYERLLAAEKNGLSGLYCRIKGRVYAKNNKEELEMSPVSGKPVLMSSGRAVHTNSKGRIFSQWYSQSISGDLALEIGDYKIQVSRSNWAYWGLNPHRPFWWDALVKLFWGKSHSFEHLLEPGISVIVVGDLHRLADNKLEISPRWGNPYVIAKNEIPRWFHWLVGGEALLWIAFGAYIINFSIETGFFGWEDLFPDWLRYVTLKGRFVHYAFGFIPTNLQYLFWITANTFISAFKLIVDYPFPYSWTVYRVPPILEHWPLSHVYDRFVRIPGNYEARFARASPALSLHYASKLKVPEEILRPPMIDPFALQKISWIDDDLAPILHDFEGTYTDHRRDSYLFQNSVPSFYVDERSILTDLTLLDVINKLGEKKSVNPDWILQVFNRHVDEQAYLRPGQYSMIELEHQFAPSTPRVIQDLAEREFFGEYEKKDKDPISSSFKMEFESLSPLEFQSGRWVSPLTRVPVKFKYLDTRRRRKKFLKKRPLRYYRKRSAKKKVLTAYEEEQRYGPYQQFRHRPPLPAAESERLDIIEDPYHIPTLFFGPQKPFPLEMRISNALRKPRWGPQTVFPWNPNRPSHKIPQGIDWWKTNWIVKTNLHREPGERQVSTRPDSLLEGLYFSLSEPDSQPISDPEFEPDLPISGLDSDSKISPTTAWIPFWNSTKPHPTFWRKTFPELFHILDQVVFGFSVDDIQNIAHIPFETSIPIEIDQENFEEEENFKEEEENFKEEEKQSFKEEKKQSFKEEEKQSFKEEKKQSFKEEEKLKKILVDSTKN